MIENLSFNIAIDLTGILGILCILLSSIDRTKRKNLKHRMLSNIFLLMIFLLFSDLVACLLHGKREAILLLTVANTANFVVSDMILLIFLTYMRLDLELRAEDFRVGTTIIYILDVLLMLATLANPIHGKFFSISKETGLYARGEMYPVVILVPFALLMICIVKIFMCRDAPWKRRIPLASYCFLPMLAGAVQLRFYGLSLTNMAALLSSLLIFSYNYFEQSREVSRQELELENARAALVLAQIQPHFLFNSMAAVMDLCDTNPGEAKDALQELSDYLHYKIYAMSHSFVVPFQEDMEFLRNYLKLEKRRFGQRLRVEYEIQASDFQLPLLTLQPLVENAIRHGISKKQAGGTIRISTCENGNQYVIRVEDDGIGFDSATAFAQTPDHVGLSNVRNRVATLCNGSVTVESHPGNGTVVEIIIQKEVPTNEHPHRG